MLQIVYISTATKDAAVDTILAVSQRNNARAGVTGLLYADGVRFLQVLEGDEAAVIATYERIARDPRHRALVQLSRRTVETREFGSWAMARHAPGGDATALLARIAELSQNAAPNVRATFEGFVKLRVAA